MTRSARMPLPHPLNDQNRQQHASASSLLHPDPGLNLEQLFSQVSQHYMVDEDTLVPELIRVVDHQPERIRLLHQRTAKLVEQVRAQGDAVDSLDQLLQQYSLGTQEGVLLMCLAEALLRVPDSRTSEALIRDKLSVADWKKYLGQSDSLLVNASTWGLILTKGVVRVDRKSTRLNSSHV